MSGAVEILSRAILIGAGATVAMDLWALLLKHAFGIQSLDYRMVGRWIGHFPHGCFVHVNIARAAPVAGERLVGWLAHYLTGIAFALALLMIWGSEWARQPTVLPALVVGVVTVCVPFLVMQPAMGMGIAASNAPAPNKVRLRSIVTHAVFGLGLYGSAKLLTLLPPA